MSMESCLLYTTKANQTNVCNSEEYLSQSYVTGADFVSANFTQTDRSYYIGLFVQIHSVCPRRLTIGAVNPSG